MLLVRHVVCPEHGEFIDARDVAEQNATAFDARADENSSAPHWTGGKQRHAEADEHCLIALVMRASFDSWKGSEARAPIVRGNIALAERDRTAPEAAISRILLAPKHSPPV